MRINGNLVFNSDATGELQNVFIERLGTAPSFNTSEKGRVYFNTATALYYFNDGSAWQPFATGGNATTLASIVANLQASVGASVSQSTGSTGGTWQQTAFSGDPILSGATSLTNALTLLSTAAYGHELLSELGDVALGSLSDGQYLKYNATSGKWYNETLVLADVTDVTAAFGDVNLLTGAAAGTGAYAGGNAITSTDLSYLSGASSNIQVQLNNKQPLNSSLTNISTFNTPGIMVYGGSNTFYGRTLQAPVAGVTITNPDGVAGDPTFALADDLAGLEGLTGTGYAVRTGTSTWTNRLIAGTAGNIVVTNGDGVASNTDIDLAAVTQAATGSFVKVTLDGYGRVTGNTAVTTGDITALVDATYVNVTGDSMSGNLTMTGGATVTGLPAPVNASDAVNKAYADGLVSGLNVHVAVEVATTAALTATYSNGTSGVGATLTGTFPSIDGYTLTAGVEGTGTRVLVKNQVDQTQNGIYYYSAAGVLTRATDSDNHIAGQVTPGDFVFVTEGAMNAQTGWTETAIGTGTPNESIVLGTDNVVFTQFSGAGTYTAGTGLTLVGGQFSVVYGAGINSTPSGDVGINLYSNSGALLLTTDGSTQSPVVNSKLALKLAAAGGLTQDTTGLYIPAAGVTNAMLLNSTIVLNSDATSGSVDLGGTLLIQGTAVQGISTSASGSTYTITAADASYSQKGVSSYTAGVFSVTAGVVTIASAGVSNGMLANSSVTITGTTGSSSLSLGGTFAIVGDLTSGTSVAVTAGQAAVSVRAATASALGVASFSATDFNVASGAVSLVAKGLNSLTDVATASDASGQTLVYQATGANAGKFVNQSIYFLYTSGAAATSHSVNHNLGQKYCNVTVVDSSDDVVIPQSIVFNDANNLTVTFTSAINCQVVVMGVNLV